MIEIEPATLNTASYVTANLRPADRAEIWCQLPDAVTTAQLAHWSLVNGEGYIARYRGQPVAFFGTSPMTVACFSVWAMGTRYLPRAARAIGNFVLDDIVPRRIAEGYRSAEARAMASHDQARKWIAGLGGEALGEPFPYGKADEPFVLYRWTVAGYRSIRDQLEQR